MGSTETEKTVVLKFAAWSNISYKYEYDTGIDRESWNVMTAEEQHEIYDQAIWSDIDVWDVDSE